MEIEMFERAPVSRAVREANRAFKPAAVSETSEYAKMQQAVQDNRERLKSERLAREAAAGERTA
jgi:hypothetical protein